MGTKTAGARPRRPDARLDARRSGLGAALFGALLVFGAAAAHAWRPARIEPRVDNLPQLIAACEAKRDAAEARNREIDAWIAYQLEHGGDAGQAAKVPVPTCDATSIAGRLGSAAPAVWAMAAAESRLLYATVNLPHPAVLVSADGGRTWHYRHLFLGGYNVDRTFLLRGLDYRNGLLAVASDAGVLLSDDGGLTFTAALGDKPFWAVAISPGATRRIVAGGDGTSFLSEDGGGTWSDLGFSRFTAALATRNPFRIDHITSVAFDPRDPRTVYVGTGSHLYRFVADAQGGGRWQVMAGGASGRVLDDSTVYNIEIGTRFMISTCNGVYYLERLGSDRSGDHADVSWKKFRDGSFCNRGVGGPKGNLRAYFVAEDPLDRDRVLVADFAGLYEGRAEGEGMRWRRIEELPYGSIRAGYPEYTSIAWTPGGETVVGSRYRGIFVEEGAARRGRDAGPSCVLR